MSAFFLFLCLTSLHADVFQIPSHSQDVEASGWFSPAAEAALRRRVFLLRSLRRALCAVPGLGCCKERAVHPGGAGAVSFSCAPRRNCRTRSAPLRPRVCGGAPAQWACASLSGPAAAAPASAAASVWAPAAGARPFPPCATSARAL